MAEPQRIYKYYTNAQLAASFSAAVMREQQGQFTSLSAQQKSSNKEWLDLRQTLVELNKEMDIRGQVRPPKSILQDLTGITKGGAVGWGGL